MIDLTFLRNEPEVVRALVKKKDPSFNISRLIELDAQVKELRSQVDALRAQKNELARSAKGGVTAEQRDASIALGKSLKEQETQLADLEVVFRELYLSCPNLPVQDIPEGNKESNKVVKEFGQKPTFTFEPQHHLELGQKLGWLDFERAAVMTGGQFALYKGEAVKLMYALTMMMLKNNIKHGFEPVIPPYLVNEKSLETASNFPKFRDQVYSIPEDGLYLSPTSEVNLANLYREHIFAAADLPKRMTSWTSCFRREAGGYGSHERGLIRIHQFEKVELFSICKPEDSMNELDRMVACAQELLQQLGLHYRISLLAGQDCSFASAKTFDIEVWMPGQKAYYEVSSCSNCTDFQARRGMMRYRETADGKTTLVHTLNASSLALPRLMVAIMETYQQADGSIKLPDVLKGHGLY